MEAKISTVKRKIMKTDNQKNFDINHFNDHGFLFCPKLFDTKAVEDAATWMKSECGEARAKSWTEQEPGVPLAVYSVAHDGDNPVSKILQDEKIFDIASIIMGQKTYLWASKVNIKAPWCGTAEYYHQDIVYWKDRGYPRDEMVSCMIFLENHNINNAALNIIPGTHKYGYIDHEPFININGLSKRMIPPIELNQLHEKHGLIIIDAKPGDALFFHTSLVHGSSHNISPHGRMVVLAQMNTVGNEPNEVLTNAREFNLSRAKMEYEEATRRLKYFKEKYEEQLSSRVLTFSAPIPKEEK
jgi:ectoine hydroxylase